METAFRFVSLETDGAIARLTLRRPPLNILDLAMIEEMNQALSLVCEERALRGLVLDSEGKAFSAGVSVADHLPATAPAMIGAFHAIFRQLWDAPCPVLAAVQGPALGGGCELACFADVVIASESATFGQPEVKLGVLAPVAAVRFPDRIGVARTLQLLLSGDILPAHEAERIGLVDRVVPAAGLAAAVEETLGRWRASSAPALHFVRKAVQARSGDFGERLAEVERLFLEDLMKTEDAVEGLRAFMEKRAPVWRHR